MTLACYIMLQYDWKGVETHTVGDESVSARIGAAARHDPNERGAHGGRESTHFVGDRAGGALFGAFAKKEKGEKAR